jgi:hypothetical protein
MARHFHLKIFKGMNEYALALIAQKLLKFLVQQLYKFGTYDTSTWHEKARQELILTGFFVDLSKKSYFFSFSASVVHK